MKLAQGQKAPLFIVKDIFGNTIDFNNIENKKIVLSFFRYAECPMCNLQIAKIMQQKENFEKHNLKLITVFESSAESLKASIYDRHAFNFTIIADINRELYELYGVHPSWLHTINTFSLKTILNLKEAFKKGFEIMGRIEGTINQIPADFIINEDKTILMAHYGNSIIDHLSLEKIFKSV
ncbi:redoxin domain-containing protein [Flavobacterium sp. FBOR7N2.3]|uniref:Redoxin domain-containing protein n=1 Tax=Flavobacterium magnesitis TaxID=3138077 RepID=A0ABV4TL83_9FLAO